MPATRLPAATKCRPVTPADPAALAVRPHSPVAQRPAPVVRPPARRSLPAARLLAPAARVFPAVRLLMPVTGVLPTLLTVRVTRPAFLAASLIVRVARQALPAVQAAQMPPAAQKLTLLTLRPTRVAG